MKERMQERSTATEGGKEKREKRTHRKSNYDIELILVIGISRNIQMSDFPNGKNKNRNTRKKAGKKKESYQNTEIINRTLE
jgi:hypothetical protein